MAASADADPSLLPAVPVLAVVLVALGHVAALLVLSEPTIRAVAGLEAGLLVVLAFLVLVFDSDIRHLVALAPLYALATLGTWYVLDSGTAPWVALLALVVVFALAGYGLHRYELVALGLVGGEPTDE